MLRAFKYDYLISFDYLYMFTCTPLIIAKYEYFTQNCLTSYDLSKLYLMLNELRLKSNLLSKLLGNQAHSSLSKTFKIFSLKLNHSLAP